MEKRRSRRKPVDLLNTEIRHNGAGYSGVIEDMSDLGVKVIAASKKNITSFIPEKVFTLNFESPSKKEVCLNCEARWVHINKTPIHGFTYRIGMEIVRSTPGVESG